MAVGQCTAQVRRLFPCLHGKRIVCRDRRKQVPLLEPLPAGTPCFLAQAEHSGKPLFRGKTPVPFCCAGRQRQERKQQYAAHQHQNLLFHSVPSHIVSPGESFPPCNRIKTPQAEKRNQLFQKISPCNDFFSLLIPQAAVVSVTVVNFQRLLLPHPSKLHLILDRQFHRSQA